MHILHGTTASHPTHKLAQEVAIPDNIRFYIFTLHRPSLDTITFAVVIGVGDDNGFVAVIGVVDFVYRMAL